MARPRKLRVEFPGAICHVMSGGDRREDTFQDDFDPQDLTKTLAEACQKAGFEVHRCCLMRIHRDPRSEPRCGDALTVARLHESVQPPAHAQTGFLTEKYRLLRGYEGKPGIVGPRRRGRLWACQQTPKLPTSGT